jgi:hypothetical protein
LQTVCGSFTNLLKIRSSSPAPADKSQQQSSSSPAHKSSINDALDNLDKMKEVQQQSDVKFVKDQAFDIASKVNKNNDALDALLAKSERAELSLQQQNKQMSKFLR